VVPPVAPVVSVWGVWDGEDLVGVYAQEQVARADAAVLRRDAVQAGVRASTIDCMPVPVFSAAQHARRGVAGSGGGVTADADVVPAGYAELLEQLKVRVQATQVRAARAANSEVLGLYWSVGGDILDRQDRLGWGGKVVDRLAGDLRAAFPDQRGWSASNLQYVRGFAAAWPDLEISPQAVGKLPWGHVRALLDRLDTQEDRDWYAAESVGQGWSRAVLEYQIGTGLHRRVGAAPSNFADQLPPADSDLAQQLVRDPYVFDHLSLSRPVAEHNLEQALMDRLQATVLEFGHGMALVGRQVRFDLDGDEQVVDLLLFHVEQLRYIVVELKVNKLTGGDVGQLGTYVAMVDDRLRRPGLHGPDPGTAAGRRAQRAAGPVPADGELSPGRGRGLVLAPSRRASGAPTRGPDRRRPGHLHPPGRRHRGPRPMIRQGGRGDRSGPVKVTWVLECRGGWSVQPAEDLTVASRAQ